MSRYFVNIEQNLFVNKVFGQKKTKQKNNGYVLCDLHFFLRSPELRSIVSCSNQFCPISVCLSVRTSVRL